MARSFEGGRWRSAAALALALAVWGTAAPAALAADDDGFAAAIERAHGIEGWRGKRALAGDLEITFGGKPFFAGKLLMTPSMSATRLETADGTVLVYDGRDAWVSPASAEVPNARFQLLTWPYFIAAPFKLRDPGARLEPLGERRLRARSLPAARLTFASGVGDSPDDWYLVYRDPATSRLRALAYIVTYGTTREAAEKEPHALVYDDFATVDGVTLATAWTLWSWHPERGLEGEPLGRAKLSNLRFVDPPADAFTPPADRRRDVVPAAQQPGS